MTSVTYEAPEIAGYIMIGCEYVHFFREMPQKMLRTTAYISLIFP